MADLDLDALEALIAYADPSAPIDHMAVYVALRDAAPALFAAAKAQTLTLNTLRNTGEEVARRGSTIAALRALLDKAEKALEVAEVFIAAEADHREDGCSEKTGQVWVTYVQPAFAALDQVRLTLAEIRKAKEA